MENEGKTTDLDMKVMIALIVAGAALGAGILSFLCFRGYYKKYPSIFNRKHVQSSGISLVSFCYDLNLIDLPLFSEFLLCFLLCLFC